MTGVNVVSGQLGSNRARERYYGSKDIKVRFDTAGTYTIKYFLSNFCGVDSFVKTICVVPKPNSSFQLSNSFLCNPDSLYITNTSPSVKSCDSSYYRWSIKGIDNNCSPSSPNWTFIDKDMVLGLVLITTSPFLSKLSSTNIFMTSFIVSSVLVLLS